MLHPPGEAGGSAFCDVASCVLFDRTTCRFSDLFGPAQVTVTVTVLVFLLADLCPRIASERTGPTLTAVLGSSELLSLKFAPQTTMVATTARLAPGGLSVVIVEALSVNGGIRRMSKLSSRRIGLNWRELNRSGFPGGFVPWK